MTVGRESSEGSPTGTRRRAAWAARGNKQQQEYAVYVDGQELSRQVLVEHRSAEVQKTSRELALKSIRSEQQLQSLKYAAEGPSDKYLGGAM